MRVSKITMRDSEYLAISSFFHEFSGNLMADGSSVQALYDIVKMVKSGLSFKSIANEEILENICHYTKGEISFT